MLKWLKFWRLDWNVISKIGIVSAVLAPVSLACFTYLYGWPGSMNGDPFLFYAAGFLLMPVMVGAVTKWMHETSRPKEPFSESLAGGIGLGIVGVMIWPAVVLVILIYAVIALVRRGGARPPTLADELATRRASRTGSMNSRWNDNQLELAFRRS